MDLGRCVQAVPLKAIVLLLWAAGVLSGCSVGPGTPLIEAVKSPRNPENTNVQAPSGYTYPKSDQQPEGLIVPEERAETEAYLKSLSER